MKIKYCAYGFISNPRITAVQVELESDSSVWIDGRRLAKQTVYECYCDSFAEAKQHILDKANGDIFRFESHLSRAKEVLEKALALEENK